MKTLPKFLGNRPHILENDFSGVVVDANGSNFNKGDNIFGWITVREFIVDKAHTVESILTALPEQQLATHQGALAQYIKIPADNIAIRPPNVTPTQAAGICLAAMTSYQALFKVAKLEAGQTIFINGGSSAVGAFAIQFAKIKGAKVVASASAKNEEFIRKMGADEVCYQSLKLNSDIDE
jgi:NADPH:quinone reductase-like Zn-dependent oxidoreductase